MNAKLMARVVAWGLALAGSAHAVSIVADDDLSGVTQSIIASCTGAAGLSAEYNSADAAEAALLARTQEIAPMSRFLEPARTCAHPTPGEAEGVIFGLDGVVAVASAADVSACSLAYSRIVTVNDLNGTVGLDCPDCNGTQYVVSDWRDALRVLLAGMSHSALGNLALKNCNSDLRRSLAESWSSLFQNNCGGPSCAGLRHVFRPTDTAGASSTLLRLLGLPQPVLDDAGRPVSTPYCNGGPYEDKDPIRRACAPEEGICSADGTLGLVLPVSLPNNLPVDVAYPVEPCGLGVFQWVPAPEAELKACPGNGANFFNLCLAPARRMPDGTKNLSCYKVETDDTPAFTPLSTNTRVYNKYLRNPNGAFVFDNQGREVMGAFYRLHSVTSIGSGARQCKQAAPNDQLGCLPEASRCSLAFASYGALRQLGSLGLAVNNILPTEDGVRKVLQKPLPADVYPMSATLSMNTMVGVEDTHDTAQKNLYECFRRQLYAEPAVINSGFISIQQNGICQDFDERQCGAIFNKNNCKRGFNFCPTIGFVQAFPLQIGVGGDIFLSVSASDIDDPFTDLQFHWTGSFGTFADASAPSTTFRCTQPGSSTLKLTVWDGACGTDYTVNVKCVP